MPGTVTGWLHQLRTGDESVAERLWRHYTPGLKSQITPRCRNLKLWDQDDIVSLSFYRLMMSIQRDTYDCTNRTDFWRLLMAIAKNAIGDCIKHEKAARRGGDKTIVSLNGGEDYRLMTMHHEVQNEEALLAKFAQLANELDRPEFMDVIELKQQGLSNADVATKMNYSLRTIQYIIRDIKQAWKTHFSEH